jgi:hypothetical protein
MRPIYRKDEVEESDLTLSLILDTLLRHRFPRRGRVIGETPGLVVLYIMRIRISFGHACFNLCCSLADKSSQVSDIITSPEIIKCCERINTAASVGVPNSTSLRPYRHCPREYREKEDATARNLLEGNPVTR